MQKTFYNTERPITVKIQDDYITFHFKNEDDREFYDIPKHEWIGSAPHWQQHMAFKNWFCGEMETFIDKNIED
jgi:hypothetical protein